MSEYVQKLKEKQKQQLIESYRRYIVRPRCSYCGYKPAEFFRLPITQDEYVIALYACGECFRRFKLAAAGVIWEKFKS